MKNMIKTEWFQGSGFRVPGSLLLAVPIFVVAMTVVGQGAGADRDAEPQLPGLPKQVKQGIDVFKGFNLSEDEKRQIGADISAKLRERYGVAQDAAVHKYVSLVGTTLAQKSDKPNIKWTFIVLDTDGVNAFSTPGGFVHITRGALALIQNESELAGVLGHEIGHITEEHTIKALAKSKLASTLASNVTRGELVELATQFVYEKIIENNFDKNEEDGSDRIGTTVSNSAGYSPSGLTNFLSRLSERNKDLKEKSGVFASYPATKARQDEMAKLIKSKKLTNTALVQPRYDASINYTLVPVAQVAQAAAAAAAAKPAGTAKPTGSGQYGVADVKSALGLEKSNSSTIASTGSRGVNPDRDAKGGSNRALVVVTITAAELEAFKKGIA